MSANSSRGETTVTIGGRERVVRFRTNQIAQLEDLAGKGIMKLMSEDAIGIGLLRDALFVGLLHDERKLTPTKVGNWLDDFDGDLAELITSVFEALAGSMPGAANLLVDEDEAGDGDEGK
tara:strand:- start:1384 stop:1743 length:360 start_codon:yes stop_codon:yes gene_type:complete